ncbi:PBECR2 nuclease fold domain-containing protein [Helicobacter canis]|uniref:Tetrahydrofolate dehydrogenase/cyclohydrolase, NAD(P)-binding domain protein n=1 Tax=Helicobacter canis TaxID=29419 RepID=A0A377J180_9HELI|nr:PBECR2 nuclease fold domain-containing protein [Helicobacter canis]STO96242.1 tetrahydrofolate dehydrogenase/cyclohydrolase, NAD(P)-binding domain protein [Helicobacter canis]
MINPREQAQQPRLRFNFDKAKQSGASDEDILEFLQSRDTNIDWGELETRSQGYQNPLAYKISTLAQNDWEFLPPKPQEAKEISPSLESTPPLPTQEDFTPTLDKLENESALREIYRDLAPSFMLTKEMEQDNTTLQKAIDEAKEQGRAFSDLHPSLKQALRKRAHQEKSVFTNPLATPHDLALESYEKDLRDLHIAKKTPQELDQSDKDYIKSRASAWDKIFASDDEIYRDFIENKRAEKIVPKEMKTALEVLDNFHQYKSIASLLTGSDEKAKTDYLNSAHTIATNLGFEGIGVNDKGELFLNHKGEFYRINSGFFESLPTILAANAGSITGGIAGAFAGAARGAKLGRAGGGYGATAGAVVGGAMGAFGGGALDTILGNAYLHRETTAQEILAHATQEGVLNIVGDMAILGAIKAYDKLKGAGIAQSLGKIIDYTPVLGFVKRSQDGNQAMAQKLLSQTYTKEQEKSLQEASENFGLALEIGDHTKRIDTTNLPPKFKDAVDKVQDIFTLKNQQQFQSRLLQAIRADESGNLLGFITEAASKSPKAHNTLTRILHQTTQKLKRNLESIAPKSSLKAIFDELEKGTKDSYDEAITQILGTIYDDTYKVNLNTLKEQSGSQSFEAFKQSLADSGVAPESSANFLNFIEKNIYNPKGVSFTQLNNALKNLNAYYKNERDPNFKTHIKQAYDSFVRSDIKAGIESIFAQNKVAYNDAKTLFDTALLDYATMKDSLKLADRLKIRDRKNTNEKALQSLLDFAKGQGDKEANLDAITKALPQGARAHIEIAMLEELFRKSMLEVRDIQVFNSTKFLDNVKELKGTFTSKAAHDYINAAEKFHALFKNDPLILQAIKPATTDKIGSSIATTLEGAVKFQVIKGIFANMIRLLPHIPLLPSVNQKVQGAALRHHLSKALESSYNIGDLKLELTRLEKRGDFTNATKEHIRAFKGELDNARQEVLDIAKSPHTLESTAQAQPSSPSDPISVIASRDSGVAIHKEAPQETQKDTLIAQKVDSTLPYTDTQGHTHQIPADIAQKWLETFGLKDLQEPYTPQFSEQVAQALEPILQGEQITLSANSLVKLMQRDRLEFLPYIKETLEHSDIIIKDKENALIFAKDIGQTSYFTSVSKNDKGEWVISTNSYKTLNQLKNRVSENGEVLYLSKEAPNILAETFTTKAFSNELASDIIPQQKPYTDEKKTLQGFEQAIAGKDTHTKIQIAKEKIKQLNKESRDLAYNAPKVMYLGRGYTKTRDKKYLDYRSRFRDRLKENGIDLDYMELEKLKQDTTLKGKARKEAMDTIYLRMYENMQQADKEAQERARAFSQKIREEELQKANEWLEKNKGASSDVDYEYKRKIAEIDKQLDLAFKKNTKDTDFIDLMNRERGKLTYAKNGDLGVVRLPEVENFYWRGYPMDLKVLRDIQKEHNYTDKNLILNGRDFSKSFEVMRAEIEARIGINPIKEFGTNYAEHYHSGESAIAKLLNEKQGQVAGAFHRKELGDIDLVWGEITDLEKHDGYGLAHILDKRKAEFMQQGLSEAEAEAKALEFAKNEIADIIENGKITSKPNEATKIETQDYKLILKQNWNGKPLENKWLVTAYIKKEKGESISSTPFTKGDNLPLNSSDIIPQSHTTLSEQAQDHAHKILQGLRKTAQKPLNKLADEEPYSTDRGFMLRNARHKKQQAQEFADNFANLRWEDLRSAIRYAKVPYDEAMFKELKESIESREFARFIESSYPHKPPQKSLFDTQELTPPKVDSSLNQELKDTPKKSQREQVKQQLQSIKNKDLPHKSGIIARLSSTGIDKMLSDKAIQKSLDNGFSKEQHLSAVADIERLFKNSDFSHTEPPKNHSADIVGVHRYINAQDLQEQNAQALITLKESVQNGNRIYSVELEGLAHPSSVDRSPKSKGVENSHHDDAGATKAARLFENPSDIIPHPTREKPKWSKADQKAWKAAKLAETRAKAQELQAKLQPIYDEVRPLVIQARKLEKPYKEEGKKLPPKVEKQVNELLAKVSESITPKQKPFEAELEKHGLQLNRTDFLHYPESGSIQVTPKQNSNLKWKNKERGEQGLKGSAKYREQALEKLSEKSYIDRLEPATKAQNPLTQLHSLKYEILKDLYKAKRYAKQGGVSYETYARYASRASDELDIIEQAIRELKNAIVPKPKRAELVRSKVQDFIKWRDEVRFDVDYLLGLESDGTKHALEYLRDLPTPTKHHASFVKDLQEQIHKHFDTDPTPPTPPSTPTPTETPKVDSTQNAQNLNNSQAAKPTPPTQTQKIPEQDLPHHAEKELYKELESLKPLKRELTQLRESGEWRSKEGRARRKELDEKIKEAEARGITSTQIQTANAKNYEKFLSKYGDMEYFKELAQASRDRYIQSLEKRIKEFDTNHDILDQHTIMVNKQAFEDMLESTRQQELDIAGQIWEIAHSMAKLREGAIYKQTDEKIGEFYTKERGKIQRALGIKPIAEFGENYAEYYRDGVGAIEKLLAEKKGQVAGAFHREGLGGIDLVWGDEKIGLQKIVEKHLDDFASFGSGEAGIIKGISEIVENGKLITENGVNTLWYKKGDEYYLVGISKGFNKQGENNWIITSYKKTKGRIPDEIKGDTANLTAYSDEFNPLLTSKDEPLNSSDIVAQDLQTPPKVDSTLSQEIKDIIDSSPAKGRDMQIIGEANFTPQVVEYAHKNNKKVAIDKLDKTEAEQLGFKHPSDVRVTIDYQAINHTLNRHGIDSPLVQQSGQKAVDYNDIAEYRSIVKSADESLDSVDNSGNPVVVSYKQVNGHFVVVEQIKKKNNEIGFKTMFKESGDYKNSQSYKDTTRAKAQTLSIGYEPSANSLAKADEIIPQTTLNGDSITNPDISYAIQNENIAKELAEKIANNGEITNTIKRDDFKKADIRYYDKDNMTMYYANIGNYTDDDLGMKGDKFFLNNVRKNEFYIPPTKSLQDFKEQSLNQIEHLKNAIKTEIDNVRDEKELHKNIREIRFKAYENVERRLFDDALYKEQAQAREFYTTQYDEAMQELQNYYDKKSTNILNEIDFNAPIKTQTPKDNPKADSSEPTPPAQKVDSSGESTQPSPKSEPAQPSSPSDPHSVIASRDSGAAIHKEPTQTPKETPQAKEPTQKGKTDFNMEVLESWSKNNEYLRDILDFIKANPLAQKIDSQLTEKWGYDSDVPPLVVFDSALLLKDKEAFLQTKDPLTPKKMQRFREKAERHFAVAQKYGLDLDGFYDFAREWRKVVKNYHIYGHTNKKKIQPRLDSSTPTPQATPKVDSTPKALTPQEATKLLESKQGARIPQELDIQSFLKSLESVENKENFIAHLQKKGDAQSRLAYLHIIEPTLKHPDIELTKGERKTKIKVFNDGENFYSFLIADLQDKRLFTFLPKARKGYIESKIKNADLIHTFTSQASKDQEPNGLAREIVAQDSNALLKSAMKKFAYDEKKAKDLLEWHKDSSPLTKDENGLPKVFYHGTKWKEIGNKIFEVFDTKYSNQVDKFLQGHYFSSSKKIARTYNANIYEVFLNAKNPLVIDFKGHTFNDYIDDAIDSIPKHIQENIRDFHDSIIFKNIIDDSTQNGKKHPVADTIMVLDSNQIKHIENRGVESESGRKYFNNSSPNIFHSNPHLGAGLLGGSVSGIEQDENGQWRFSPEKFALGLLGGVAGSKAVAKGLEWRAKKVAKSYPNIAKDNPQLMQEIAKRDLHTYATTSTHNALTRFLHNNKLFDINPQLFAGEKALANEAYAPHKARLERAKELEAKGAKEIEIWEQTGWYKDKDQRWKFEISQRGGELDIPKLEKAQQVELGEILQDKELFNAYPQLKTLVIKNDKTLEAFGLYMPEYNGKSKHLSINLGEIATTHHTPKEVLYHELQHAIQDIEGFAYGRNYYRQAKEYFDLHGEVEARNVQARLMQDDALARAEKNLLQTRQELEKTKKEYDNILAEYKKVFDNPITAEKLANDRIHSLQEHIYKQEQNIHNLKTLGEKGFLQAHPHKTMDTSIYDTNAEATMMGEALSKKLESSFLDSSGRVDYKALESYAIPLPNPMDMQTFSKSLLNSSNATPNKAKNRVAYKTPAGVVNIYIPYAYRHFSKQGNKKENRFNITGALIHILDNPAFVTKDEAGTLYFYKPFKNASNITDIVSISIAKNGKIEYKTTYEATKGRLKQMIMQHDLIYMGHKEVAT